MAATSGIIGKGVTLGYGADGTSAPTTYADIAEIVDLSMPGVSVAKVDFTNSTSPDDTKEYKPGWKDPKTVSLKVNYVKVSQAALEGLAGEMKWWKITYPDAVAGSTHVFRGFLSDTGGAIPIEDRVTADWQIQQTGAATFTAAS